MKRRRFRRLCQIEQLEPKQCLSAVTFVENEITDTTTLSVDAADIDGDGDSDLITLSGNFDIGWQANDGKGHFGERIVISSHQPSLSWPVYRASDVDGDGDLDFLVAQALPPSNVTSLYWHENTDSLGGFGEARVLVDGIFLGSEFDVGDVDVVSSSYDEHNVVWFQNVDGHGTFGEQQVIGTQLLGGDFVLVDLDGDNDVDVLSILDAGINDDDFLWFVRWHENRLIGDSNNDGVFDSSDLVAVFQAGEYEDDVAHNSTFDEGDWNGDGEFDSGDLVLAFQAGTFVAASKQGNAAAIDLLFASNDELRKGLAFVA